MRSFMLFLLLATVEAFYGPAARMPALYGPAVAHSMLRSKPTRACADAAGADAAGADSAETSGLYASLQARKAQLTSRSSALQRERTLVEALMGGTDYAQQQLWYHWFGEEGEAARKSLESAKVPDLLEMMETYPDWAEPANRLATLRYIEGDFDESVELCLKVLRLKPWHFGASSGIVMVYAKMGNLEEANKMAELAMPRPGPQRKEWVQRMLEGIDAKLAELEALSS